MRSLLLISSRIAPQQLVARIDLPDDATALAFVVGQAVAHLLAVIPVVDMIGLFGVNVSPTMTIRTHRSEMHVIVSELFVGHIVARHIDERAGFEPSTNLLLFFGRLGISIDLQIPTAMTLTLCAEALALGERFWGGPVNESFWGVMIEKSSRHSHLLLIL
jgi:hypothetical protein